MPAVDGDVGSGSVPTIRPRRAVLYARVSTDKAEQDPETQLAALRSWCAQRGWAVVAECADRVTGDPTRRRGDPNGLAKALRLVRRRKADVVAVFAADRLVRSPQALLALVARIQAAGGHVASLQDGSDLDTTSDVGELLLFVRGWFARMELRLIRSRIMAGLDRARANGVVLGRKRTPGGPTGVQVRDARAAGLTWPQTASVLGTTVRIARRRATEP